MASRTARTASGTTARVARVLVVDDEPHIARSLQLLLSDEFDVTSTTDPLEALGWLTSGDWYDTILCDVMMLPIGGVELRSRVLSYSPELAARIVFVTGGILMPSIRWQLEDLPNTVLAKPFDSEALRDLIRRRTAFELPVPRARRS